MTTRILVLSASVGAGHIRAAQAVELALREVVPEATVRNLDVLDSTNAPFRRLYGKFYLDLVNKAPHVLGYFYDLMDQPSRSGKNRADRLRLAVEKLNLRKFVRLLKDEPPDRKGPRKPFPRALSPSLIDGRAASAPDGRADKSCDQLVSGFCSDPDRHSFARLSSDRFHGRNSSMSFAACPPASAQL
jgi:hypothetical protein